MFARIAAAISRFLASIGKDLWNSAGSILDWTEQVVKWPFRLVFGHGQSMPDFTPRSEKSDVVEEYKAARAAAIQATQPIERDGLSAVVKYARARPGDRADVDLSGVRDEVRDTLFRMSDVQLELLASASDAKVRKFAAGKDPEILGVEAPSATPTPEPVEKTEPKTEYELMLDRIRQKMRDERRPAQSKPFELAPRS